MGATGSYTWETTSALEADAQGWYDEPENNFGWILIGSEGESGTAKRFATRENEDLAARPQLRIEFEPVTAVQSQGWAGVKRTGGIVRRAP